MSLPLPAAWTRIAPASLQTTTARAGVAIPSRAEAVITVGKWYFTRRRSLPAAGCRDCVRNATAQSCGGIGNGPGLIYGRKLTACDDILTSSPFPRLVHALPRRNPATGRQTNQPFFFRARNTALRHPHGAADRA